MNTCFKLAIVAAVFAASGCAARRDPFRQWQNGVSRYVFNEGRGDLSVLRQLHDAEPPDALRPDVRTVGVLNTRSSLSSSTDDVQAAFVGIRTVADKTWHLFVAAHIRSQSDGHPVVDDIRVIGAASAQQDLLWRTSESDPSSVAAYLRNMPVTFRRPFPAASDSFVLSDVPGGVQVKEERSGAVFRLALTDPPPPPRVAASSR